jgi:hypothetical protein
MRLFTCWRAPPWSSNAIHSKGGRVRTRLLLRSDESRYQLGGKPAATDERSDRVFSHSTWAAIDPVEFVKRARDREVHEKELRLDKWLGNCMDTVRARRPRVQVRARGCVCTLPTRGRQSREVSDSLRSRLPMPTARNWQHDGATEQPQRPSPESWGHPISSPVRCVFEPGWPSLTPRRGEKSVARLTASAPLEHLPTNGVEKG